MEWADARMRVVRPVVAAVACRLPPQVEVVVAVKPAIPRRPEAVTPRHSIS